MNQLLQQLPLPQSKDLPCRTASQPTQSSFSGQVRGRPEEDSEAFAKTAPLLENVTGQYGIWTLFSLAYKDFATFHIIRRKARPDWGVLQTKL